MSKLVLIIEDEPDLISPLDYNLRRCGYQTRIATTGESAIRALDREPTPDIILLDLMLPDVSEYEVYERIRSNEETARIPIIIVSALSTDADRVNGIERGVDDYVIKPYSPRELILRMSEVLARYEDPPPRGSRE